ncbi:hypothetical protein BDK51DRAFT_36793 [Blyttiomyces helicus]|uniref:Uncharacterized protein n=1 Tax=Blyttiomyces helicus TaxID=388810 RepID=A0A4P9WCI9_9FUNG|nr:hypothetical protein BDK51DRAFT_36793 [Blyttiomyces helicus]|eukprot:RKO89323.1 hypothetical protein BDK51DRAFT_36793 [Blyttiomyces helicus]
MQTTISTDFQSAPLKFAMALIESLLPSRLFASLRRRSPIPEGVEDEERGGSKEQCVSLRCASGVGASFFDWGTSLQQPPESQTRPSPPPLRALRLVDDNNTASATTTDASPKQARKQAKSPRPKRGQPESSKGLPHTQTLLHQVALPTVLKKKRTPPKLLRTVRRRAQTEPFPDLGSFQITIYESTTTCTVASSYHPAVISALTFVPWSRICSSTADSGLPRPLDTFRARLQHIDLPPHKHM